MGVKSYQSSVELLSDGELGVLSAELEEAYERSGYDGDYWTDDEAEDRHLQMRREIHRRWALANPEEAAKKKAEMERWMRPAFGILKGCLSGLYSQNRCVSGTGEKVGRTIMAKRPRTLGLER